MTPHSKTLCIAASLAVSLLLACKEREDPKTESSLPASKSVSDSHSVSIRSDEVILAEAEYMALAPLGYGAVLPEQNQAWGRVLETDRASQVFEDVFSKGTLSARIYALLGLRLKDLNTFNRLLPQLESGQESVEWNIGCFGSLQQSMAEFIRGTKEGEPYESWDAMAKEALKSYQDDLAGVYSSEEDEE